MRKALKLFFLIISLSMFGYSAYSVLEHWNYEETLLDLSQQIRLKVTPKNLSDQIELSISQNQFDDARMYLDIAKSNNFKIGYQKYHNEIAQRDTSINRLFNNVSDFTKGFVKGDSANMAGIAGSVSADFTVLGDARDLYQQYGHYEKGEHVNELIVVLSGAGIGLTALTVGTLGSAAPAKAGTSILKIAAKSQKLSRPFQKILLRNGRKVFSWADFTRLAKQNKSIKNLRYAAKQAYHPEAIKPLKQMAGQVNNIRKSSSTIDAIYLLKYVDDGNDLRHLEKITLKYGTKSKGMMKLLGKGAIRTVKVLKRTAALIVSIVGGIISALFSLYLLFSGLSFFPREKLS